MIRIWMQWVAENAANELYNKHGNLDTHKKKPNMMK